METARNISEGQEQTPSREGGARELLRGVARRRLERRGARAVKRGKKRARAFGRGAAVGYAIQENPARATAIAFVVGCCIGAIALGITQVLGDFQTLMEEEFPEDESVGSESKVA